MYFVVEWITRSAPSSIGFCSAGDRKVLSTAALQPTAWARAQMSATSTTRISGFDGRLDQNQLGVQGEGGVQRRRPSFWSTNWTSK